MTTRHVAQVVNALLKTGARKATKYVSKNLTVKASRRHKASREVKRVEVLVTFGEPNFAEREFLKACRRAGEALPVKKIQLRQWAT